MWKIKGMKSFMSNSSSVVTFKINSKIRIEKRKAIPTSFFSYEE